MKTVYELRRRTITDVAYIDMHNVYPGCTFDMSGTNADSELLETFEDEFKALKALSMRSTYIRVMGSGRSACIRVEEYWVEDATHEFDEDGDAEWVDGGDICGYSSMPELLEFGNQYTWDEKNECWNITSIYNDDDE